MEYLAEIILISVSAALINNVILHYFVGICPFIGVSRRVSMAFGMGAAVTFVITIASMLSWLLTYYVLQPGASVSVWAAGLVLPANEAKDVNLSVLSYIVYILVIAGSVQFVEMYLRKFFPALYKAFGVYLPLITTNCAILFVCLLILGYIVGKAPEEQWDLGQATALSFFSGAGFTLAIVLMAGIREELDHCDVPRCLRGPGITLITAGILALAFLGFAGMDRSLEKLLKPTPAATAQEPVEAGGPVDTPDAERIAPGAGESSPTE